MTPEQFDELKKATITTIKETVNGKIDRLQASQIETNHKLETYIKEDNEWKEDVKPHIETMKQFSGFTSTGTILLKTIMLIGGAFGVIFAAVKYLKQ